MGNQLSGIASSQILSVDHYFSDLAEYEFDSSLGSTRFFKVARAKHKDGLTVVKVFAIQDPSLPLKSYQDELNEIKTKLLSVPNVLCFQKSILSEKSSILIRQYCKDNLYDRISTRPFLNLVEKKWIVFQLLAALDQCHSVGVCHGDIKTENVMVTGWNWLLLTDIASFKPVFLPEDNPADFSFFFDTSRRRVCYIAPERFLDLQQNDTLRNSTSLTTSSSQGSEVSSPLTSLPDIDIANHKKGKLTPSMDIFSAGCVISELFLEGNPLFDLSQLLAYRAGDFDPTHTLEKIDDSYIRELVSHMIQKESHSRHSAAKYMELYRGSIFPEQFYTFLKNYNSKFASSPVLTADEKISRIKRDIQHILQELCPTTSNSENDIAGETKGVLVIIVSLVTSCIRSCKYCVSKLSALDLLTTLSEHVCDEVILERLIPYVLFLVQDPLARVRAKALTTLTTCLQMVQNVPRSDAHIFPEYILPSLSALTQDNEVLVRVAYAENIAGLAETALRFLEIVQLDQSNEEEEMDSHIHYQASYDVELQALHEIIQRKVVTLLSDTENVVKQTLLENGITRLCVFFGRQKANDVLLSHMITFLNDKQDWQLRGAFFDSIVGVAAYVGWQSLAMLKPLLQQGLSDTEEFVICKAMHALTCLSELGLLQKPTVNEFAAEIVSFLVHPSMWVRYGAVGFISSVARTLNIADVHCNLHPLLHPYIKQPIVQVNQEVLLVSVLKEPISRSIYDYMIRIPQISALFDSLQHRQLLRNICRPGQRPDYEDPSGELVMVYRKLHSQGLTESDEDKLLFLKDIMLKLHRAKASVELSSNNNDDSSQPGEVQLKTVGKIVTRRHADMWKPDKLGVSPGKNRNQRKSVQMEAPVNQPMMAAMESGTITSLNNQPTQGQQLQNLSHSMVKKQTLTRAVSLPSNLPEKSGTVSQTLPASQNGTIPKPDDGNNSTPPPVKVQAMPMVNSSQPLPRYAVCRMELRKLVYHKRDQYSAYAKSQSILGSLSIPESKSSSSKWNPKGMLIAHLHEHKAAINKLEVSKDSMFLATGSDDGTVKIWESQKLEGKTWVNKSRQSYNRLGGKVKTLTFCQSSHSIACASEEGAIHVFRIERVDPTTQPTPPPRLSFLYQRVLDPKTDGHVVDLTHFDSGSSSVLTYATSHGLLCGWDLRSPGLAWSMQNDPVHGLTTSFVVDPCQCWLTVGTSTGTMVCWDLRFKLPITSLTHPRGALIRRLTTHPLEKSWVLSAVQGNNEVSMWDLETGSQRQTLWASHAPPLSQSQVSTHAVNAIYACPPETSPYILTAGSDKRIRLWDMAYPEKSRIIAASATDNLNGVVLQYKSQLIDGTEVYQEVYCKPKQGVVHEDMPRRGPEQPPVGHHDSITDLALIRTSQNFIASSSRDGVLKIWK